MKIIAQEAIEEANVHFMPIAVRRIAAMVEDGNDSGHSCLPAQASTTVVPARSPKRPTFFEEYNEYHFFPTRQFCGSCLLGSSVASVYCTTT